MRDAADRLLQLVRGSRTVLLTGPEGPDGDSIGACLALRRLLRVAAPEVEVVVAGRVGHRYALLPDAGDMIADADVGRYDGVVVLDGDRKRVVASVARAFDEARWTGLIDHHRSTELAPYAVSLFDPAAESTCGMVATLADAWGVPIDVGTAELLYAGIVFDTGAFRYSNTHASTHRLAARLLETGFDHATVVLRVLVERRVAAMRLLAALLGGAELLAGGRLALALCPRSLLEELGAGHEDLEGIVDLLQHTEGVELAVVVVEKDATRSKLSLRSRGRVDVASLARSLDEGGGGHAKAAGVVLTGSFEELVPQVRAVMVAAVR